MADEQEQTPPQEETPTTPTTTPSETPSDQNSNEQGAESNSEGNESGEAAEFVPLTAEDLAIPEGFEVVDEIRDKFLDVINDREMSANDRANALIELQAETIRQASERISEAWTQQRKAWVEEVKADPEIGGDKLEPTMGKISKLLNEFGDPNLREQVFDITGAGDHPLMIKFLAKVADALSEGTPVSGDAGGDKLTLAERMYPSMKKG